MNRSQSNRLLAWALAVSLVVHAVFAIVVRNTPPVIAQDRLHRVTIIVVKPPPIATLHPARGGSSNPSHVAARPPTLHSNMTNRTTDVVPVSGTPGPAVPGSPGPAGTPKPSCANPNVPARSVQTVAADFPEAAREAGATGTTQVKVSLFASGAVAGIAIYSSSGNVQLDQAAERAARQSSFSAELRNCQPVAGDYLFRVDFQ
jgi:TonB family protein